MSDFDIFLDLPLLDLPVEFAMAGHGSHDDPFARFSPGLEGSYVDREHDIEVGFSVHAIVDGDYMGQWMLIQLCTRDLPATTAFGDWHYGFYYRGGDSTWDRWHLDLGFAKFPGYARFGEYVDQEVSR